MSWGKRFSTTCWPLSFDFRARWAELLLDCEVVQGVLDALSSDGTITTINNTNTFFGVAAGGFEGQTNPTYVFTVVDSGVNAASAADIETLVNALGYVLSQGGTVHFDPDDGGAHDFPLDYITISFDTPPSGDLAQSFFEHVGTIDSGALHRSLSRLHPDWCRVVVPATGRRRPAVHRWDV